MGAGGVADPIQGDSEEFGASAPRKERVGDDEASESTIDDSSARPGGSKRQKTGDVDVSGSNKSSSSLGSKSTTEHKHESAIEGHKSGAQDGSSEFEQISSQKVEKYVNLDEDEVNIASASTEEGKREARADRRADALGESKSAGSDEAQKHGGHADVEELHGQATQGSGTGGSGSSKSFLSSEKQVDNKESENSGHSAQEGNDLEQVQRHQAEKFGDKKLDN